LLNSNTSVAHTLAAGMSTALVKPKRATTAYMHFNNEARDEVTKEYREKHDGKMSIGDIAKIISARWAALDDAGKKKYEDLALESKLKQEVEMKAYLEESDPAGCLKKKYEHLIPKKPSSTYFLFNQDPAQRQKAEATLKAATGDAEFSVKMMSSKLGEMWKSLSATEKGVFEEQHKKAMVSYDEKLKIWEQTPEFEELQKVQQDQKAAEKAATKEDVGSPPEKAKKRAGAPTASPSAKRTKPDAKTGPTLEKTVLEEAQKLGYDGLLKNLAGRSDVAASGVSSQKMLDALKESGGLVNQAKQRLLGA